MTAAEFSLLAVVVGFTLLVLWVYSPGRRGRLESYGAIPLEEDDPSVPARHSRPAERQRGERSGCDRGAGEDCP